MKPFFTFLLFSIVGVASYAHEGIGFTQDYGNVRVLSYKEVDVEAFRKAFIIGQLTKKLADELQYTEPIYLDFHHNLFNSDSLSSIYHVSVENFKYHDEANGNPEKLIIRQYANDYDVLSTLKLIAYAILNKGTIKKIQQEKENPIKYGVRKFLSVNDDKIASILQLPITEIVAKVMQTRIDRPVFSDERRPEISYYWQNNQYHVFRNMWMHQEKENVELLTLSHMYQFVNLDLVFLLFDSSASFYYININRYEEQGGRNKVSARHIIEDVGDVDWGKTISRVSHDDVSIYFTQGAMGSGKKRMLLYFQATDTLVQDVYAATGIVNSNRVFQPTTDPEKASMNQEK